MEKIQWHPGFYAGIELELRAYHLDYDQEHQVTRGPLSIDLLIIKKQTDEIIDHEIGEFFRKHNVVEFKSPDDELSVDVFYKVQSYAGLYKAAGETINEIPADEVTVSLFRDCYPREILRGWTQSCRSARPRTKRFMRRFTRREQRCARH